MWWIEGSSGSGDGRPLRPHGLILNRSINQVLPYVLFSIAPVCTLRGEYTFCHQRMSVNVQIQHRPSCLARSVLARIRHSAGSLQRMHSSGRFDSLPRRQIFCACNLVQPAKWEPDLIQNQACGCQNQNKPDQLQRSSILREQPSAKRDAIWRFPELVACDRWNRGCTCRIPDDTDPHGPRDNQANGRRPRSRDTRRVYL